MGCRAFRVAIVLRWFSPHLRAHVLVVWLSHFSFQRAISSQFHLFPGTCFGIRENASRYHIIDRESVVRYHIGNRENALRYHIIIRENVWRYHGSMTTKAVAYIFPPPQTWIQVGGMDAGAVSTKRPFGCRVAAISPPKFGGRAPRIVTLHCGLGCCVTLNSHCYEALSCCRVILGVEIAVVRDNHSPRLRGFTVGSDSSSQFIFHHMLPMVLCFVLPPSTLNTTAARLAQVGIGL
jgi:hypothetical protein